jgi:hypothetical protein
VLHGLEEYSNPAVYNRLSEYSAMAQEVHGPDYDPRTEDIDGDVLTRVGRGNRHGRYWIDDGAIDSSSTPTLSQVLLGRRQSRHPSLEVFAAAAGLTETKQAGTPFADSAPDEDLRRSHPTVRPRPAQRPACDPAHCNGPCVAAVCYGPNL